MGTHSTQIAEQTHLGLMEWMLFGRKPEPTPREARREYLSSILDDAIAERVNEEIVTDTDERPDEPGRYDFLPVQDVIIELEDDAMLAWYAEQRRLHHTGTLNTDGDSLDWTARVTKYRRTRRCVKLWLTVE